MSPILEAEATATPPPLVPVEDIDIGETATEAGQDVPVLTPGASPGAANKTRFVPASPFEFDSKIIGHSPAPKHAYPWMVAMLIDGRHFCGGSLIDAQHVLTAAHCTDK